MVENAWDWSALRTTNTISTQEGIFNYILTGSNNRFEVIHVLNDTDNFVMQYRDSNWFDKAYLINEVQTGSPSYYSFNGVDANGDTQVNLYPIPDGSYQIFFNIVDTQTNLVNDSDMMLVPMEPVVHLAYAKALVERGEDGRLQSSEAYALFKQVLADYIAIESSRYVEEEAWVVV
jgi:hypothetical protein